jgi:hypothetical protein
MSKGFGKSQSTGANQQLVDRIVRFCEKRSPEALDRIFDSFTSGCTVTQGERLSEEVIVGTVAQIQADVDTLAWFCGYMAGEINRSEDNELAHLPLTNLSKQLVECGFRPFLDFVPYPGRRIVILDAEKVEALSPELQAELQAKFDLLEKTAEELQQVNEALRQEFVTS